MMHRPEEPSLGYVNPSEQVTAPGDEDRYVCWLCGCARWEHDCPIAYRMEKGSNEPETWEGRPICQRCADEQERLLRVHPPIADILDGFVKGAK